MTTGTDVLERTTPADTNKQDEIDHYYCPCSPEVTLCGLDTEGMEEGITRPVACVVCDDLDDMPCRKCGY